MCVAGTVFALPRRDVKGNGGVLVDGRGEGHFRLAQNDQARGEGVLGNDRHALVELGLLQRDRGGREPDHGGSHSWVWRGVLPTRVDKEQQSVQGLTG